MQYLNFIKDYFIKKSQFRDILNLFIVAYVLYLTILFQDDLNGIILKKVGNYVNTFLLLLSYPLFNFLSSLLFFTIASYLVFKLIKESYKSLYLILSIYFIYEFNSNSLFLSLDNYSITTPFSSVLVVLLYLIFSIELFQLIYDCILQWKKFLDEERIVSSNTYNQKGFNSETKDEDMIPVGWEHFEDNLTNLILGTDVSKESYAIGICGEWGTGKTTFLNYLEKRLAENCLVIRFNPWGCTSSDKVIDEFFSTLGNSFKNENSDLSKSLKQYSKLLLDINLSPSWLTTLFKYVPFENNNISSIKEDLQRKIGNIKKKVIISIDDVDRLEKDELFEILRLIRVTANFKNTLFLVAYDKDHVRKMLNANHIDTGDLFIKKIFPLEITIPSFETNILPSLFISEVSQMIKDERVINAITQISYWLDANNEFLILRFLNNFRDVKRFANSLSLNISSFIKGNNYDINITEFSLLELVRYSDLNVYEILRNQPFIIFNKLSNTNESSKMSLKKLDEINTNVEILSPDIYNLLDTIFNRNKNFIKSNSVIYYNNYEKYFSYRPLANKVDNVEFKNLLGNEDMIVIRDTILKWCTQVPKKTDSLRDVILNINPSSFTKIEQGNYITSAFLLSEYDKNGSQILRYCTNIKYFNDSYREYLRVHLYNLIRSLIVDSSDRDYLFISNLVSSLYSFIVVYEGESDIQYQSIIDDSSLQDLSNIYMNEYLREFKDSISIFDITQKDSILGKIIKNSVVHIGNHLDYDGPDGETPKFYKCLVLDSLINYFKINKQTDVKSFLQPYIMSEDDYQVTNPEDIYNSRLDSIAHVLGDMSAMERFIKTCFVLPSGTNSIKDYIKNIIKNG